MNKAKKSDLITRIIAGLYVFWVVPQLPRPQWSMELNLSIDIAGVVLITALMFLVEKRDNKAGITAKLAIQTVVGLLIIAPICVSTITDTASDKSLLTPTIILVWFTLATKGIQIMFDTFGVTDEQNSFTKSPVTR